MNSTTNIRQLLDSLGKSYAELIERGLDSKLCLIKVFPEDDDFYLEPLPGISYQFHEESKTLQAVIIVLITRVEEQSEFEGELSAPYQCSTQAAVREVWGIPARSKGPMTLPLPFGRTGGWDLYSLAGQGYEGLELAYKYATDLRVSGVVLRIKEDDR
jgi:hypothetical protein